MNYRIVNMLSLSSALLIILSTTDIQIAQAQSSALLCRFWPGLCPTRSPGGTIVLPPTGVRSIDEGLYSLPLSGSYVHSIDEILNSGYEAYSQRNYGIAEEEFSRAEELAETLANTESRALALVGKGEVFLATDRRRNAVRSLKEAKQLLDRLASEAKTEADTKRIRGEATMIEQRLKQINRCTSQD